MLETREQLLAAILICITEHTETCSSNIGI